MLSLKVDDVLSLGKSSKTVKFLLNWVGPSQRLDDTGIICIIREYFDP